ncbi:nucleoside/nucleotide kinase family protein [Micromonospora inositola]|uniref:hypothetical protein n=1 Tax=Micromonospora inositola TaxID=47865 RepID=UPI0012FE1D6D|nr:hypothetical protein [Micromonospora inositola]
MLTRLAEHLRDRSVSRRGSLSAEGYYRDSFDQDTIVDSVLRPLGPDEDGRYLPAAYDHRLDEPVHDPLDPVVLSWTA